MKGQIDWLTKYLIMLWGLVGFWCFFFFPFKFGFFMEMVAGLRQTDRQTGGRVGKEPRNTWMDTRAMNGINRTSKNAHICKDNPPKKTEFNGSDVFLCLHFPPFLFSDIVSFLFLAVAPPFPICVCVCGSFSTKLPSHSRAGPMQPIEKARKQHFFFSSMVAFL